MAPIIEVKNIGKKYNISHQRGGYIALRDVLSNIIKSPFSFTKDKVKSAVGMKTKEEFWALKNVSFSIEKGEVVGIIGSNGAGKSTLMKILSQITPPTEGEIIMQGKVSSLLEVGTGFHPELTGRENIFLNGAILGMSRKEMNSKFDEIIEFAGIEKFLDTPVKYYSSGMYVRLAFSVAAHMEPDILLVDEVLAVGDAEFQKKCLGKMEETSRKDGRTILFISHNMPAIRTLCKKSILLEKGEIAMIGNTEDVVEHYLSSSKANQKAIYEFNKENKSVSIEKISILNERGIPNSDISISEKFKVEVDFVCEEEINNIAISSLFYSSDQDLLLYSSDSDTTGRLSNYKKGSYKTTIDIPAFLFNVGRYYFDIMVHTPNTGGDFKKSLSFEIINTNNPRNAIFQGNHSGKIAIPLIYETKIK